MQTIIREHPGAIFSGTVGLEVDGDRIASAVVTVGNIHPEFFFFGIKEVVVGYIEKTLLDIREAGFKEFKEGRESFDEPTKRGKRYLSECKSKLRNIADTATPEAVGNTMKATLNKLGVEDILKEMRKGVRNL